MGRLTHRRLTDSLTDGTASRSLPLLVLIFAGCAAVIWIAGGQLSNTTDIFDDRLHLGSAIGGDALLAIATKLPEIAITVAAAVSVEGRSKSEVAREYGVSRRWVITLVQRYLADGEAGLAPRSRRPLLSPCRTSITVEDEIVEIRKDLDKHGHEAGAATIAFHLQQRDRTSRAVSTIWRILTQRGFVTPQPHKRPKSSYIRFQAEQPNERWQSDISHWPLADGSGIEILNWLDDHYRLCLASSTQHVFKAPTSTPATVTSPSATAIATASCRWLDLARLVLFADLGTSLEFLIRHE